MIADVAVDISERIKMLQPVRVEPLTAEPRRAYLAFLPKTGVPDRDRFEIEFKSAEDLRESLDRFRVYRRLRIVCTPASLAEAKMVATAALTSREYRSVEFVAR